MASGKCIDNLPDELLLEIFSNFTTEQLAMTVQHVSRRWKEVSQDNSLWKNRDYSPEKTTTDDEIIQHLRNMPMLKKFSPKRGIRAKRVIDTICSVCRNIQQLEFTWSQKVKLHTLKQIVNAFPDLIDLKVPLSPRIDLVNIFTIIGQFKKLTRLDFTDYYIETNEKVLAILADKCPSLQHIDLGSSTFLDEDIKYLLEKKQYQLLSFSVQCYISTETYIILSECTNLEYLVYVNDNDYIPDTYIHLFSKLTNIKNLSLSCYRNRQSRNILNMFANNALPYLTRLNIAWCDNIDAQTLNEILRNCPGLEELMVCDNAELEGGFESIGTCKKLEKLTLKCSSIEDKSFEYIGAGCHQLKHLTTAILDKFTDESFEYIVAGCPLLEYLQIDDLPKITDGIFENLLKFKNLRFLSISHNGNIIGTHFDDIPTYLVHLETLQISWCVNLKTENIKKLQTKMPQLKIEYDNNNKEICHFDFDLEDVQIFN